MCGIAGTLHYKSSEPVEFDTIHAMTRTLQHRGPDDEGYYIDSTYRVGLGHRRLSIIDLSSGKQPISNEDGTKHIVFNGEIYNYRELRDYCLRRGHCFKTQSDTEVILHLYEEKGVAAFAMLNGVFAIAIHDEKTQTTVLARDRFGVKPLYYSDVQGKLLFASEIKAILQNEASERHVCYQVADAASAELHFRNAGIEIILDKRPVKGTSRFFVRDPGGNYIEIAQMGAGGGGA